MAFNGKEFLQKHGEKVGLGVVGTLALLLLVFAILRPSLDAGLAGGTLLSKANTGAEQIKVGTEPTVKDPVVLPPKDIVVPPLTPQSLLGNNYVHAVRSFIEPVMPLKVKRTEPVYLAIRDLRATAGRGYLGYGSGAAPAAKDAKPAATVGGGMVEGVTGLQANPSDTALAHHFVVLTGLVPAGEQLAIYQRTFTDTLAHEGYDGKQDVPEYFRYLVERAEVQPGVADDQLTWTPLSEMDDTKVTEEVRDPALAEMMQKWAGKLIDKTPQPFIEWCTTYVNPPQAAPEGGEGEDAELSRWLPPLLLRDWKPEEIVHPTILKAIAEAGAPPAAEGKPAPKAKVDEPEQDAEEQHRKAADKLGMKLFRHFDFTVEPGKQYKYRVTLVLRNPNRGFDVRYLDVEKFKQIAQGAFRHSNGQAVTIVKNAAAPEGNGYAMSKPVWVPLDGALLTGDVVLVPARGPGSNAPLKEPKLKVLVMGIESVAEALARFEASFKTIKKPPVEELDAMKAAWESRVDRVFVVREADAARGSWLNLEGEANLLHPIDRADSPLKIVRVPSNVLLLDYANGLPLSVAGAKPAPVDSGDVLMLDGAGRPQIRNRYEDTAPYQASLPPPPAEPEKKEAKQ